MKLTGWKLNLVRVLVLVGVFALTALLIIYRDKVKQLEALGYPGIFLVSLFSNATLILPIPGVLFTSAMGAVFNPGLVALVAGTGATIGEISGYLAGFQRAGGDREPCLVRSFYWLDEKTRRHHHSAAGFCAQPFV